MPSLNSAAEGSTEIDVGRLRAKLSQLTPPAYWRSLDELAETAEFRNYIEREFPSQLAVWEDPIGRRRFLQLMAASLALAGVTACTRPPDETIVPYVLAPEQFIPGKPLFFATAMPRPGDAIGLLAESHMGRPTKLEGNPLHPASLGATDAVTQASILSMYDPDRSQTIMRRGLIQTWDRFSSEMVEAIRTARGRQGAGLRLLTESVTSPTLADQLQRLLEGMPEARWHQYQPLHDGQLLAGTRLAFGRDLDTVYQFDRARVIVSLDADFLYELPGSVRYARDYMSSRRATAESKTMNRCYVFETSPTITGASCDHRWPVRPDAIDRLAESLAARLNIAGAQENRLDAAGVARESFDVLVAELEANRGASIVVAGPRASSRTHALVHAINAALGNHGTTIRLIEPVAARPEPQVESLRALIDDMQAGAVDTLLILGGNPVYATPQSMGFVEALSKVPLRVHLSQYYDETSMLSDWHVPEAHFLESWGDTRAFDGTVSIIQPLIAPLYGGRTAHDIVGLLAGEQGRTAYEIIQGYWQGRMGADNFAGRWRAALHDGIVTDTASPTVTAEIRLTAESLGSSPTAPANLVVEFRPDPNVGDGRFANNGWLQELPKPLTKITWDNVALISPATAASQGLSNADVVSIQADGQSLDVPVWIMPGQPEGCIALSLGYGRRQAGRVGTGIGYDAYGLLPASGAWSTAARLQKTDRKHPLATTQNHHSMEGRDIVRVTTLAQVQQNPEHLNDAKHHGELPSLYPEYAYDEQPNAWGMVIDQTACIGCNACVVACQAENNIPIVGKEQVEVGREMHWLRIDRYYHGEMDNPETYFQPMMCVHCEKAPCEVVCPVAATVHDSEGTSNMIYNRCVGTRYCSNNCPYKVRRFNYLQYTDQATPSLKLMRNPDVTVRSRGVMEKCSYCIQRISSARIHAKKENRAVADGEVLTACQQACPTQAIVFGNLNDSASLVGKLKQSPLNYGVLAELNTQPRTTYLPRIVNAHPDLPQPTAAVGAEHGPDKDKAHS